MTLVLNLDNLAATEYSTAFTGLAGDIEATATGVYQVGGADDAGVAISGSLEFGLAMNGDTKQQRPRYVYVHGTGAGSLMCRVTDSAGTAYEYEGREQHGRVRRFVLGAGLRDAYLKIALFGDGPDAFLIDQVDFESTVATNRRL